MMISNFRLSQVRWKRLIEIGTLIALLILVALMGSIIGMVLAHLRGLPKISELEVYKPSLITRIYADDGEVVAQFYAEKRILAPLADVPKLLQDAIIAVEDARFYRHFGVDLHGIARAVWANIRAGKVVEGGSTITQQLAKRLFLTNARTLSRKIKEILLALQIEHRYSKEEILGLYLNQVYFGHGAYGAEAAANTYFGKHVRGLNLAECTMLAGLPSAPAKYSPYRNPEEAKRKQAIVLRRMVEEGYITQVHAQEAKDFPLELKERMPSENEAPYFVEYVRQILEVKYGSDAIYKGGLHIYTTLDLGMQKAAQRALREGLERIDKTFGYKPKGKAETEAIEQVPEVQGALVAIEPQTGYIKAMVGGYDFSLSPFNRAVQAHRQPGSGFKPFIYTTAIDNGFPPTYIIMDSPVIFTYHGEDWIPINYDKEFHGPTTLRTGLAYSRNVVTVRLLNKIGVSNVIEYAHRMGIKSPLRYELSLALGASEVTPIEMASAYGVLANQGIKCEPMAIKYVKDSQGNLLEENIPQEEVVLDSNTAYVMTNLLEGAVRDGTGWRARALGRPVAAKTGTTNECSDAWFIGFTPELVCCVYVGFDKKRSLGEDMTGSRVAGPIWVQFIKDALTGKPVKDFIVPDGVVFRQVDAQSGLLATKDCTNVITEVFIKGTEPTSYWNIYRPYEFSNNLKLKLSPESSP
jgi:penicillin-binding protein 1A